MDEPVLTHAAYITLRRAILERFPPQGSIRALLRWLRARQGTEAPAGLIDVRKRRGVLSH